MCIKYVQCFYIIIAREVVDLDHKSRVVFINRLMYHMHVNSLYT